MDWVLANLTETLLIIGIVLLVIEILVLGFSTFVLFFVGIAALITSLLIAFGLIPETLVGAAFSVGLLTALSAALLWKPLRKSQNKVDTSKVKSDLVGHSFILTAAVSPSQNPLYRYSGIDWKLVSQQPLAAGTNVEVVAADVGVFTIAAKINP
jgi:membrane protein implicated in regulation of membrane protease activity